MKNKILITGSSGFIGFCLSKSLLDKKFNVVGIDNHNNYYDVNLKKYRCKILKKYKNFSFHKVDLNNYNQLKKIYKKYKFDIVVNLAAQAGVRFSLLKPRNYINDNINGFFNILELSKDFKIKHFIYASTSSVYGLNNNRTLSTNHSTSHQLNIYSATKKSNEVFAHAFSHLYKLNCTGLRFFTVYGPWGRPDMSLFKFTKAMLNNQPLELYNKGNHYRDFTYIDDVIDGIIKIIKKPFKNKKNWNSKEMQQNFSSANWRVYNIGNNNSVHLKKFVHQIQRELNIKKVTYKLLPLQKGDIYQTLSNTKDFKKDFKFKAKTNTQLGIKKFISWYKSYFNK